MFARRILLYAAVVLLALSIAALLSPREDEDADDTPATTVPRATDRGAGAGAGAGADGRVTGTLTGEETIAATVGEVVEITVPAEEPDRAEIVELGVRGAVGPGLDSPLIVIPDRAGEFPVTLRFSGRRVGTLSVAAR